MDTEKVTLRDDVEVISSELNHLSVMASLDNYPNAATVAARIIVDIKRRLALAMPVFRERGWEFSDLGRPPEVFSAAMLKERKSGHESALLQASWFLSRLWYELEPEEHERGTIGQIKSAKPDAVLDLNPEASVGVSPEAVVDDWQTARSFIRAYLSPEWRERFTDVQARLEVERRLIDEKYLSRVLTRKEVAKYHSGYEVLPRGFNVSQYLKRKSIVLHECGNGFRVNVREFPPDVRQEMLTGP